MESLNKKIQHVFETVRSEINHQRPIQARQMLRNLREDVEAAKDPLLNAEYRLLQAENAKATMDPQADEYFEDTKRLLKEIKDPPIALRLRVLEHHADFLCANHRPSLGRTLYNEAKELAASAFLAEDIARIQLKLLRIDLETDKNPELPNYQTMKRLADRNGSTATEQLMVWVQHISATTDFTKGLRFARNKNVATESYFSHLFDSVREREDATN